MPNVSRVPSSWEAVLQTAGRHFSSHVLQLDSSFPAIARCTCPTTRPRQVSRPSCLAPAPDTLSMLLRPVPSAAARPGFVGGSPCPSGPKLAAPLLPPSEQLRKDLVLPPLELFGLRPAFISTESRFRSSLWLLGAAAAAEGAAEGAWGGPPAVRGPAGGGASTAAPGPPWGPSKGEGGGALAGVGVSPKGEGGGPCAARTAPVGSCGEADSCCGAAGASSKGERGAPAALLGRQAVPPKGDGGAPLAAE